MGSVSSEEKYVEGIQEEDEAFSLAMTVVTGAVPTIVLQAAIELGLLEIIKKAGSGALMSASEIASELPNNRNKDAGVVLDRMLSLLASHSIISCSVRTTLPDGNVERLYGLAPPCKFLTKNEDGDSLGVFFPMMKLLFETSAHFKDVVLDGGTAFEKTFGMTIFERIEREPSFNKFFNDVMSSSSRIIIRKLVDSYEGFKNLSSLVDVAGGTGATLNIIISKYPKIKGINFDLPHVVKNAPPYPGVEHVGGDMFISIPHGEAILMKWNCHCWSDKECINMLKNCRVALPDHGKVIVCDYILPNEPNTSNSARTIFHLDMAMLAQTGGKERTEEQFEGLAKAAGFEGFRVVCSVYDISVMEFLKN